MNKHEIAVPKATLTREKLLLMTDAASVRPKIEANVRLVREARPVVERRGIFQHDNLSEIFTFSGGLSVPSLEVLSLPAQNFFAGREGRAFRDKNTGSYDLRGPRYMAALDTNLSIPQQMHRVSEDFSDGLAALNLMPEPTENQHLEVAPVLDYVKEAAITALHTHIYAERTGDYRVREGQYQQTRRDLVSYARKTVRAYYRSLLGELDPEDIAAISGKEEQELICSVLDPAQYDMQDPRFKAETFLRPELEHPLTVLGAAQLALQKFPQKDTVLGSPTGGTELSMAIAEAYSMQKGSHTTLLLLPLSLQTRKKISGESTLLTDALIDDADAIEGKDVLIVDDNSATGRTMQILTQTVLSVGTPARLDHQVAEADIMRSRIDLDNPKRTHIANQDLFDASIAIQPVSTVIHPKRSLRKVAEQLQLANYYREKAGDAPTLEDQIKYEVFANGIMYPIDEVVKANPDRDRITSFRNTWLSNFYPVPVMYDGHLFPTAEHAYQFAKFDIVELSTLSILQRQRVQEVLASRGVTEEITDFTAFFTDPNVKPGTAKKLAEVFEALGLREETWDDKRVDVMVSLLVQKYAQPEMMELLLGTGDALLIEGNTWNDTYWGVCEGQGRNMLGDLLMNIRGKLKG